MCTCLQSPKTCNWWGLWTSSRAPSAQLTHVGKQCKGPPWVDKEGMCSERMGARSSWLAFVLDRMLFGSWLEERRRAGVLISWDSTIGSLLCMIFALLVVCSSTKLYQVQASLVPVGHWTHFLSFQQLCRTWYWLDCEPGPSWCNSFTLIITHTDPGAENMPALSLICDLQQAA